MKIPTSKPLFIFEMANNHMGDVDHGLRIIRGIHEVSCDFDYYFAFKFQYRQLDTFIHMDFKTNFGFKYIKRFSETRLSTDQFKVLREEVKRLGFIAICTSFDEESVDRIEAEEFDIIKVASCSFTDWPLLERVVRTDKPIIASTAGVSLQDIDKVVSFFEHRQREFVLMHCVAAYPTKQEHLQLNQIELFRSRYPNARVGYSTHEDPDNFCAVQIAIAMGATVFEKHVGVPGPGVVLNPYTATPAQVRRWLEAASDAFSMCGVSGQRPDFTAAELSSLHALRRGVFARRPIRKGEKISRENVFLAIPLAEGQITANDLSKYTEFTANVDIEAKKPALFGDFRKLDIREKVYGIVQRVRAILEESNVVAPGKADFEISHHYGIDRFEEFGTTMITVVNRFYCKKLIIMLAGQKHPEQYHKQKEETFHVLFGEISISLNGVEKIYKKGDVVVLEPGVKHSFGTRTGGIIEEISTTHYKDDSYYTDPKIAENKNRKTLLTYWMG